MSVVYLTEGGTQLGKEGGRFYVARGEERLCEVPAASLEGVVLFGGVQVSAAAVTELLRQEVPVSWMSAQGRFHGRLDNTRQGHVLRQRSQFRLTENEAVRLSLARRLVAAKVHNQRVLLRRHARGEALLAAGMVHLAALEQKVPLAISADELLGLEGAAARRYFACLGQVVPAAFAFEGRSRQPPRDPVNSLLSFGYQLLFTEVYTAVVQAGLHPYLGFLHQLHPGHAALVSDLMEEWRPVLVDALVLTMLSRGSVKAEDFQLSPANGGVYLSGEGRKRFVAAYEKRLRQEQHYLERPSSFRQGVLQQARRLAQAVDREEVSWYQPLQIR